MVRKQLRIILNSIMAALGYKPVDVRGPIESFIDQVEMIGVTDEYRPVKLIVTIKSDPRVIRANAENKIIKDRLIYDMAKMLEKYAIFSDRDVYDRTSGIKHVEHSMRLRVLEKI